jgi:stage II sporulation protein D
MRARTPRMAAAVATAALLLATASPAEGVAPTDPQVTIPPGATTLTVNGDGWGHGHGMSQWGAQGAALQGLSFAAILEFYYPGTQVSSLAARVRVLITADTDNNTTVRHRSGLTVSDLGNGKTYRLHTKRTPRVWRLKTVSGQTRLYYRTARWHLYRTGGRVALKGAGEFRAPGPITLRLQSGDRAYRGGLRYVNSDTVNVLSLEKYLRGVVPVEAFPSWQPAALQAQAVAARTYAAYERAANVNRYYQICDTSACQVYRGSDVETSSTNAAVAATNGRVLLYAGQLAFTQFSASSGGWTSTGSQPYLTARADIYDTAASGDTNLGWHPTVKIAAIENAHPEIGTLESVQIIDRDGDSTQPNEGWVLSIKLTGSSGTATMTGREFQALYGLKSAYFSLASP